MGMGTGRVVAAVVSFWLLVAGGLTAWTWAMYRLFQEGQAVLGAVVGMAVPAAVTAVSLVAWGTTREAGP